MISLLPCLTWVLASQGVAQGPSPDAKAYLEKALDLIEKNSIKRTFNFKEMRLEALEAARDAKSVVDTYPAIRKALESLNDHHSFFMEPTMAKTSSSGRIKTAGLMCLEGVIVQVRPGGPADQAGVRPRMTLFEVNGSKPAPDQPMMRLLAEAQFKGEPFSIRAGYSEKQAKVFNLKPAEIPFWHLPQGSVIDGRFGYVHLAGFSGTSEDSVAYATAIQSALALADQKPLLGWIVDLRVNTGGNMFPMIAGLGPLLGDRKLGSFVFASNREDWKYENGAAYTVTTKLAEVKGPVKLRQFDLPIAVLTSGYTASSGEATLISFLGDPRVKTFGASTYGVPTGNESYPMSDGAMLVLCTCLEADRTGKTYDSAIPPDVAVKLDWKQYRSAGDPTVAAAKQWILQKTGSSALEPSVRHKHWFPDPAVHG